MRYPEPIPLGVSDGQGHVGAITPIECDIDLINLLDGTPLRRLARIGSPLMIDGPNLIGWQRQEDALHSIRLFRLPLSPTDASAEWSERFDLPVWARPQTGSKLDFAITLVRDDEIYGLYWKGQLHDQGGTPPPRELTKAFARRQAAERIDVDANTLNVLARRQEDGFADEHDRAGRGEYLARHSGGFIYRQGGRLRNAPWATPAGERYLRALGILGDPQQRLSIARAEAPDAPGLVDIGAHDVHAAAPELSLDGKHLAVVVRDDGSTVLHVSSAETGKQVGNLPYHEGFAAFRVFDSRLVWLEEKTTRQAFDLTVSIERRLHGINLDHGGTGWIYALEPLRTEDMSSLPP
jgi:hypothetical protein